MKFNHVCKSGNDFDCEVPDSITARVYSHNRCMWERPPSDADIAQRVDDIAALGI